MQRSLSKFSPHCFYFPSKVESKIVRAEWTWRRRVLEVCGEEEIKNRGLLTGRGSALGSQVWLPMRCMVMNDEGHVTAEVATPAQSTRMTPLSSESCSRSIIWRTWVFKTWLGSLLQHTIFSAQSRSYPIFSSCFLKCYYFGFGSPSPSTTSHSRFHTSVVSTVRLL